MVIGTAEGRRKKEEGRRKECSFLGSAWKRIYRGSASTANQGGRASVYSFLGRA
ncbi:MULTISPECIES: hypothetical protein [unclassified Microcoleus]|uniref:hypothetical protein n=1 Tax=unclassified Microcoleus TaxID=2642155 RepID=UPI002FD11137